MKAKKIRKSDIAVSITGIAGPKGGTRSKPVGLVFIGIKKANKVNIYKCFFKNKGRTYVQKATVRKSLDRFLRVIILLNCSFLKSGCYFI